MKRIKFRAGSVLILAALILAGLTVFAVRFVRYGENWALFPGNQGIYRGGVLNTGTLYDKNGMRLAGAGGGIYHYADDADTRAACLHAVGDYEGNIGTGALSAFSGELAGYNLIEGTYNHSGGGRELKLTIDARLNVAAFKALGGRSGAVLVMNYKTGELLAMVSSPSYDPSAPPDLSADYYKGVYLNRAISASFTPGSVFKIVTLAAAIENIPSLDSRVFNCNGSVTIGGSPVNCTGVHGSQSIEQAFNNSCNCAFAEISLELGARTLSEYAGALGLTSTGRLSGIETAAGSFAEAGAATAELAWSGIGQYEDLVCPFSVLRLVGAIAGGGLLESPYILDRGALSAFNSRDRLLRESTAEKIAAMMSSNVTQSYGEWNFPGLEVCAKTGTAEVGEDAPHAWIAGFVSDSSLPLAFAVIVENGGAGLGTAAPVANAVLQVALANK